MLSRGTPISQRPWFPWVVILLAAWLAHACAWRAAFYMDDFHHILMRDSVTGQESLAFGWKGRFLTIGLWRMVYAVFGPSAVAFHGLNWFLHGAVAVLSFAVLRAFVRLGPEEIREDASSLAFWGGLLFAVHPLCVEPVHYAAQTSLLLATLLAMGAVWAFLRWKDTHNLTWGVLAIGGIVIAGMAKEVGFWHALILVFFVALLGDVRFLTVAWWRERQKARLGAMIGLGVLGILFAQSWLGLALARLDDPSELGRHALTQARVLGEYLRRMIVPVGLSSDHHIAWTRSWSDTEAVIRLVITGLAALWVLERYLRGRRWLAALFGLCLFHLLVRFAYTVDEPMVEYRTYPAMPWVGLLFAVAVRECTDWRFPSLAIVTRPILILLVLCFSVLTWSRSQVWQSERQLVTNVLHQYPLNLRAMGIYFKDLVISGYPDSVLMGADMPDMVSRRIAEYNAGKHRGYSERRMHLDYTSCQYYIIRAHLHAGEAEVALEKADALLVDLVMGRRAGGDDSFFTAYLSLALCHRILGNEEAVAQTIASAGAILPRPEELPEMLDAELVLLGEDPSGEL